MQSGEYLRWYARSALGIGSGFAGIGAAAAAMLAGLPIWGAALAALGLVAATGLVSLAAGWGPRQALAAREAWAGRARAARLAEAAAVRERIAALRIPDGEVAEAARLVALAAGEYIDACRREGSDDPLADAAIGEALELVGLFLKEKDEAATERRFGLDDADPFPDARGRVAAALKGKAAMLRERRIQIDGGLPPESRMAVREEIE
jgi:hypothetical protein